MSRKRNSIQIIQEIIVFSFFFFCFEGRSETYTVFDEESESEVNKLEILDPGGKQ